MEEWECRLAKVNGKMPLVGLTIQATKTATISHSALSGGMDDNSNCEAGIINFRNRKARESNFAPNRDAILQGLMMVYTNQRNILEGNIAVVECKDRTGLQGWS